MSRDQMLPTRGDDVVTTTLHDAREMVARDRESGMSTCHLYWEGRFTGHIEIAQGHLGADPVACERARAEIKQLYAKEVA